MSRESRVASRKGFGALLLAIATAIPVGADAQAPRYDMRRLDGAVFTEELRSDVVTQSGAADRSRSIIRNATYSFALRRDTLVATADTVWLHENSANSERIIDVDAVIGARWRLVIDALGAVTIEDVPVVTREIADVSDFAAAMDDFFPIAPPAMALRGTVTDTAQRTWRRLADSAGLQRFHTSRQNRAARSQSLGDTVSVRSDENVTEDVDLAWDLVRGPVAWSRHIVSIVTSRYSGRTLRATADQHIVVRRVH